MLCLQVDEILKSPFMNVENLQRQPRFLSRQKGPPVVSEDGIAAIAEDQVVMNKLLQMVMKRMS